MITPEKRRCPWIEPSLLVQNLVKTWGEEGLVWLDGDGSKLGRWVILGVDPINHIYCDGLPSKESTKNPFEELNNLEPGHWTGWLSYEAGAWLEPKNSWKSDQMAMLWMVSHDPVIKFDLQLQQLWLEGCNKKRLDQFDHWLQAISKEKTNLEMQKLDLSSKHEIKIPLENWKWLTNRDEYSSNVKAIKELIAQGDIFQANLTACCITSVPKKQIALELFLRLKAHSPAPFSGLVIGTAEASGQAVISRSPERFLKVLPSGEVETRPIKGTRPRHQNPIKDADLVGDLICSPKDRAENIMIVDLLRNDLGKVCKPGSIIVPQLVGLESYRQVHHLTSVIQGSLIENKTWVDLLKACWPGGSISGAPKLRACERLNEIEPTSRGPYCGSLMHLDWDGRFDSSIVIRSLILHGETLRAHAGCGIVADSCPQREAEELTWKIMPLLQALE